MIRQGALYWIDLDEPEGSEPGYRRPHVIVQNNLLNDTRIRTVLLCPLTTNVRRAEDIGNVLLDAGEGGLTKPSVVLVSQFLTIDRAELTDFIGILPASRIRQIIAGIHSVLDPVEE